MTTDKQKNYNKRYYELHKKDICAKRNKGIRNDRSLSPGEIFFDLTVIKLCEKDTCGKICYLCKCKCGQERKVRRSYLLSGRTKSCGCGKRLASSDTGKRTVQLAIEARRKFVGDLSGALWSRILRNAKCRKLEVTVTKQQVWELFLKQQKKCALSGLELYLNPHHINRHNVTASLDRIDSNKGYIEGNIQWIHKDVNLMKNHFPEIYFKEICRKISLYDTKPITVT